MECGGAFDDAGIGSPRGKALPGKRIKMSDEFTGAIAFLLHQLTGCHALAAAKLYGGDPNVDHPCLYKECLAEICRRHKIGLVLDLHGAAREREFDVDLGTNGGKHLLNNTEALKALENMFRTFGLAKVSHDYFAAKGENTIANFAARELRIPAIQVEINKHYRVPAQNPLGFHRLLGALAKSIEVFGAEKF